MIYDANSIDLVAARNDGGLDMFIVSSGHIDASPKTQTLLLDKVENYLGYIASSDFDKDFPDIDKKKVRIIFNIQGNAPELLLMLCEKISDWTNDSGVDFVVQQNYT